MKVDKTIANSIRGSLRKDNIQNRGQLDIVNAAIREAQESLNVPFIERNTKRVIKMLNEKYGLDIPSNTKKEDLMNSLYSSRDILIGEMKKIDLLSHSISKEGIKGVTYGLPALCISMVPVNLDWAYLVVSGIKTNAEKKSPHGEHMDDGEKRLLEFERQMGMFITEDYRINPRQVTSFLGLMEAYIRHYYDELCIQSGDGFNLDKALNTILMTLSMYIIYSNTGIELTELEKQEYSLLYSILLSSADFTRAGALRIICDRFMIEYSKRQELGDEAVQEVALLSEFVKDGKVYKPTNLLRFEKILEHTNLSEETKADYISQMRVIVMDYFVRGEFTIDECLQMLCDDVFYRMDLERLEAKKDEPSPQPVTIEPASAVRDEIYDYIENGVVVKRCNLEKFRELLNRASLSDAKRWEYEAQMRNFINRSVQEEFDSKMDECRRKYLNNDEIELYQSAKTNVDTIKKADYIDDCIEMLIDNTDDDEIEILCGEIENALDDIRIFFKPTEDSNDVRVIYYTVKVGKETVPKLLTTLLGDNKQNYKQAHSHLTKLLSGLSSGDREVLGDDMPCHILAKGKDFKIFYAIIGGVIVIIDGAKGKDAYQKIKSVVSTEDFKKFITSVRQTVASGVLPNAAGYTEVLMNELEKSKSIKKIKKV